MPELKRSLQGPRRGSMFPPIAVDRRRSFDGGVRPSCPDHGADEHRAAGGARTPHKEDPCIRSPRGGADHGLGRSLKIKALETVGRPAPGYSMRTQTRPGDAVPAIESPRSRARSAQKKRPVAAAGGDVTIWCHCSRRHHCSMGGRELLRVTASPQVQPRDQPRGEPRRPAGAARTADPPPGSRASRRG